MMRFVRLWPDASRDIDACVQYIARDNIEAAIRLHEAARAEFKALAENPGLGRPYPVKAAHLKGLRKWNVRGFSKYLIFYLVHDDRVEIVRFLHGARDIDAQLEESE